MGYWANGSGDVILKEGINREELRQKLDTIIKEQFSDMEYDLDESSELIYFWENDTHWHEEDTMEFLNALIPYIKEGCAEYRGEEDCNWRYILINGKWIEQGGTVYYSLEDMIKELEKQGYVVTNKTEL